MIILPPAGVTKDLLYSLYVASPTNLLIMRRAYGREADDLNGVVALEIHGARTESSRGIQRVN